MNCPAMTNNFGYVSDSTPLRLKATPGHVGNLKKHYISDNIGNRSSATNNSSTTSYTANNLNQYSQTTSSSATNNFSFDADGNMLTNGEWTYTWNGENRLISASNSEHVISYSYDFQGRCYEKIKDGITNSFMWDGYNIISETSNSQTNYNIWGLDLSGTLQGAGGVGGLLATVQDGNIYFTAMDANGNITEYISDDGTVQAHREYSAFGETIALIGTKKNDFTHWWSTKPWDADTGMSEYEYRKLLVGMGRWGSRDPIGEEGGVNVYVFAWNRALFTIDILGQLDFVPDISGKPAIQVVNPEGDSNSGNPLFVTVTGAPLCDCANAGVISVFVYTQIDAGDVSVYTKSATAGATGAATSGFTVAPLPVPEDENPTGIRVIYSKNTINVGKCPEGEQNGMTIISLKYGLQPVYNAVGGKPAKIKVTWTYACKRIGNKKCPCGNGYSCETEKGLTSGSSPYVDK